MECDKEKVCLRFNKKQDIMTKELTCICCPRQVKKDIEKLEGKSVFTEWPEHKKMNKGEGFHVGLFESRSSRFGNEKEVVQH